MIGRRPLDEKYEAWNQKWHAPYGNMVFRKCIPGRYYLKRGLGNLVGMFAIQPNNTTRAFEYPWAFYAAQLEAGFNVVDIGAGFSGFPFVLSKLGMHCTVVDPFFQYGPSSHYPKDPARVISIMNRIFGTKVSVRATTVDQAQLPEESVDRVFCLSVIEHLATEDAITVLNECRRILKPGGLLVMTVDLFLDVMPFTDVVSNSFGTNASIADLVAKSGLSLVQGETAELCGFPEFNPKNVRANLDKYYQGEHAALAQAFVLRKNDQEPFDAKV
jgi:2-polyprenyl-3-methyl-5-hydroxy-6-metoxy-1,4-benzoquinol methylase